MKNTIKQLDINRCTGCKMCADLCPKSAISFETNKYGFWYPQIDDAKCVDCGACYKKCPELNEELSLSDVFDFPRVFSAWSRNEKIRLDSTSGAVFFEFGKYVIENGGYIIGSGYSDDWKSAYHFVGQNMTDLYKLKGSKYFQSDTEGIYSKVKDCVLSGKMVLFVGCPCQIAATKAYLGKDYDNLILMDFICRGINSPLPFKKFIECLEDKYSSNVSYVQLKNKRTGWESLGTLVQMENGKEYHEDKWHNDIWVKGFLNKNLYMRPSCHQCKFRNVPHGSDITIGDFWGISNQTKEDMFKGISSVMVNTKKGEAILRKISDCFVLKEKSFAELLDGNPALKFNPPCASDSDKEKFFDKLETVGFEEAIESIHEVTSSESIVGKLFRFLKKCARKVYHAMKFAGQYKIGLFIKLNYLSKNIKREKGCYIYPHKNAIVEIHKTASLNLKGKSVYVGINKPRGSRAETFLRMDANSRLDFDNGALLFYNTTLELKSNATLKAGFFSVNTGSAIICAKEMEFGEDVMMGRNIIIYDSDFHQMNDADGFISNFAQKVTIEDHVWLTSNIVVLKGVTIGRDSLISAYVSIKKDIPPSSVVSNGTKNSIHELIGCWSRDQLF